MDSDSPYGPHRNHKRPRSHAPAHMDAEGEPTWGFASLEPAHTQPHTHTHTHARSPSSQPPHRDHAFHHWPSPAPAPVSAEPVTAAVPAASPALVDSTHHHHLHPHPYHHPLRQPPDHSHVAGLHLPPIAQMAAPQRFEGDGLDFRRPIGWPPREEPAHVDLSGDDEVIDLTADDAAPPPVHHQRPRQDRQPRLPRGMDIIIDLDNGEEDYRLATPPPQEQPRPVDTGSPEIEFISARPRSRPRDADADEVEFLRENPLPEAERRPSVWEFGMGTDVAFRRMLDMLDQGMGEQPHGFYHLRAQIDRTRAVVDRAAEVLRHERHGPILPPRNDRGRSRTGTFIAPDLDFRPVGFDLGLGEDTAPAPAPATYSAPTNAPDGFTRSPEEDDVLLCPNCEDELCTGDDDVKRQVWMLKHCGHVYCGECTANRLVKRSAKGKEKQLPAKTKPFKECVIEDCPSKATKKRIGQKGMIQLFM